MSNGDAVRAKVQSILSEHFTNVMLTKDGGFSLRHHSARLFVELVEQETRVIIKLVCPLLFNVKPSPELYKHVALHADDYFFGHLSLREDSEGTSVWYTHELLGDYLDSEELTQAIIGILGVANDLDDELREQFGGDRFHEDD